MIKDLWLKIVAGLILAIFTVFVVSSSVAISDHSTKIAVLETRWFSIEKQLEKIDSKLDDMRKNK